MNSHPGRPPADVAAAAGRPIVVDNPLVRFRATIELGGKSATGIRVPEDVVSSFGAGRRVKVRVTIGDYTYRTTVGPYGGAYMLPLSAEHRQAAGVAAGDEVDVDLDLDDAPREVTVPPDLAAALAADPQASAFFDGLSYTRRRWFVLRVEEAKKAETRERRVATSMEMLREGRTGP